MLRTLPAYFYLFCLAQSATLAMETQALDLVTDVVLDTELGIPAEPTDADRRFAYNADRTPHEVVFPAGERVTLALLNDKAFEDVSAAEISALSYFAVPLDLPIEPSDTMAVRTANNAVFKLGKVLEDGLSVTFDYMHLQ